MDEGSLMGLAYPDGAKPLKVEELSAERKGIYGAVIPGFEKAEVKGVVCEVDGAKIQHVVMMKDGKPEVQIIESGCKIMLDDLSPTQMVEYKFKEGKDWMLGWMGEDAAMGYRAQKFKLWREMIEKPSCEAAFKRILQTGLVTRLYDTVALPTPAADADKWTVINEETGKKIDIPHPVEAMRIWDAESGDYRELSSLLEGAPEDKDAEAFWNKLIDEQKEKHGADVIEKLMSS